HTRCYDDAEYMSEHPLPVQPSTLDRVGGVHIGHMNNVIPQEGRWYSYRGSRELYQVINIDDADRVIYFQDSRGDIDEVDFDEWYAMDLAELLTDLDELQQFDEDDDDYLSEPDFNRMRAQQQAQRR